jgi:DnaK suppressor protein
MKTMTAAKKEHFKKLLLAEKSELEIELEGIGRRVEGGDWMATPEDQENESDYIDQADHVEEYESKVGRLRALEGRFQEVERALARIEEGTYGFCLKSGEAIEEDRLEANPAAETCKAMMNAR